MARRKTSATSRRSSSRSSSKKKESPGWVWAVAGLSVGLLIAAFVWLSSVNKPGANRPSEPVVSVPKKQPAKQPTKKPQTAPPALVVEPPPKEKTYGFYDMLPKQTIEVPTDHYRGKDKMQPLLQSKTTSKPGKKTTKGQYILQAGSFRNLKDADRRKAELALMGMESRIEKVQVNDGYWHRIIIGPFKKLDEANQLRTRLHSEKIQTMLGNTGK